MQHVLCHIARKLIYAAQMQTDERQADIVEMNFNVDGFNVGGNMLPESPGSEGDPGEWKEMGTSSGWMGEWQEVEKQTRDHSVTCCILFWWFIG